MAILLVRHGETDGNARRIVQVAETPLSERGLAQARRLADRLRTRDVARILSSDLARARMTAEAIAERTGAPISLDPRLQERNFGDLRGTPYAELTVDLFAPDLHPPGGESWAQLNERADAVFADAVALAARAPGRDLVVVTHGLVCHAWVARRLDLAGLPAPAGFGNTALTIFDARPPHRVERMNCTAHLDETTGHDTRGARA